MWQTQFKWHPTKSMYIKPVTVNSSFTSGHCKHTSQHYIAIPSLCSTLLTGCIYNLMQSPLYWRSNLWLDNMGTVFHSPIIMILNQVLSFGNFIIHHSKIIIVELNSYNNYGKTIFTEQLLLCWILFCKMNVSYQICTNCKHFIYWHIRGIF